LVCKVYKDHKESQGLEVPQDPLVLLENKVPQVHQVGRLGPQGLQVQVDSQVNQAYQVIQDSQVNQEYPVIQDSQVNQGSQAQAASQVNQGSQAQAVNQVQVDSVAKMA
jgi:hypothetical protein